MVAVHIPSEKIYNSRTAVALVAHRQLPPRCLYKEAQGHSLEGREEGETPRRRRAPAAASMRVGILPEEMYRCCGSAEADQTRRSSSPRNDDSETTQSWPAHRQWPRRTHHPLPPSTCVFFVIVFPGFREGRSSRTQDAAAGRRYARREDAPNGGSVDMQAKKHIHVQGSRSSTWAWKEAPSRGLEDGGIHPSIRPRTWRHREGSRRNAPEIVAAMAS